MSLSTPVKLMDVHSELSSILFAVRKEFEGVGGMLDFELRYREGIYLQLQSSYWGTAEQKKKITEILTLRLQQGILWGEYDYRFEGISYSTHFTDHVEPHYLTATVDLNHWPHRKPHGWTPPVKPSERSSRRVGKHPALGMPYGKASRV